ncbi:hypothetical protein L1987_17613 [Smallanthus sonchifolius]|uniref:Uncharacterized protein n=1 Tax=Smallanthus sonchifolius TaxID=185202 RepID=A0ACB9IZY8_9ASTR|nr:hypothetical protein L1987_17613 [Smallanthus sonchifolius]
MDAVELPLPAAIVTKIMRSSGCSGGGGVNRVELLGAKSERETCSSSFHPEKDGNDNVNGSKPGFWDKIADDDLYRKAGRLTGPHDGDAFVDRDMVSVQEAKQSQRKSGKASRSNGSSSRRSRVTHMEASLNVTGAVDVNDLPKELGSYPGKYNVADKTQTAKPKIAVSGKRSEKRNGKIPKNKCDSFSVKAGLSSFSSAAGGNNILGVYGSKHDICDLAKHMEEVSLNELLDGSYKSPNSIKVKEKPTEALNGSILQSVREACSILHLQKLSQTPKVPAVDATYNYNASSFLPNSSTNDDNKGDAADQSPCNKVESSCTGPTNHHANILQFPLFKPKDVLDRLTLPPHKDLDLMLLDSMKPTSTSKVHNGGSLPSFPWSHISGGHFKANPDVVKSTPSKSTCQGRWVKMGKSTTSLGDIDTTTYLADFQHLTYNQSLVPVQSQQPGSTGKEKSPLISTLDREVTPSGTSTTASKNPDGHSAGVLSAAQTLCNIAAEFRKQDQYRPASWQKKSSQKSIRASKLTSDEKLEKALFTIPSTRLEKALFTIPNTRPVGPTNLINYTKAHTSKKLKLSVNDPTKGQYHWSTSTPQSSRSSSSPSKSFKNSSMEAKHHESSSSPLKRSITIPPEKLPNKPSKLRKLVPMEWKSRGDEKGNAKY